MGSGAPLFLRSGLSACSKIYRSMCSPKCRRRPPGPPQRGEQAPASPMPLQPSSSPSPRPQRNLESMRGAGRGHTPSPCSHQRGFLLRRCVWALPPPPRSRCPPSVLEKPEAGLPQREPGLVSSRRGTLGAEMKQQEPQAVLTQPREPPVQEAEQQREAQHPSPSPACKRQKGAKTQVYLTESPRPR